ncbi:AIPR family protein [Hymenobacter psychrophilus]|uniref:AIPR protein n=1 Tax=Hymenobacter psychrophilus TaxID=651662 RepID=A0A1H3BP24_9BACT|nr:AIPR family protein [Hymenobacter psychrophilus]SDX42899.1 AIPR protein [Hymenobacter psychrophilus]
MDKITRSLIDELLRVEEISSEGESKDFEKLVNYTVISNEYNKTFELDLVTVGDGNDTGIDGIAIIVNGLLVETIDEIDELIEKNDRLDTTFIFIQAKTSSSFSGSDINSFIFGVKDFFSEKPKLLRNDDIVKFAELANYIYDQASFLKKSPDIKLYYVTTGKWLSDLNLSGIIESGKLDLETKNLFDRVVFHIYGAKELTSAYRKTKENNIATVNFSKRVTIPQIDGVSESYVGLLPFSEFRKIIVDDNDNLKNVFEDNVRDFQGKDNDVNNGISRTINGDSSSLFSVLNNGVTIVASNVSSTGDTFVIRDYQIVNGCQTSNMLYSNRLSEGINNVFVPLKVVATTNEEIKNQITLATNNQTPIKKEQLAALTEFQRNLERYYNSFNGDERLHYERRSKQYNTDTSVIKARIITIPIQIKSFSAMFLQNPHLVTSFFGSIVNKLNSGSSPIFQNDHAYESYYTSALAFYRLEGLFKRKIIDTKYKKARFHLLMVFKELVNNNETIFLSSQKQMERYCKPLLSILNDDDKCIKYYKASADIIDNSDFDLNDKQQVKSSKNTQNILDTAKKYKQSH